MSIPSMTRRKFLSGAAGAYGTAMVSTPGRHQTDIVRSPLPPDPHRQLHFGIIGVGYNSYEYIEAINHHKDTCDILALCDIRKDRLDKGIEKCNGTPATYADYKELLKHPGLNVIYISTPHNWHAPMAIDALNAGYDVLVEKPMAMNVTECHTMNAAAQMNNRLLIVAEEFLYTPQHRKMKALLDAGEIGDVKFIWYALFRGPWHPEKRWLNYFSTSGGGILAESCHEFTTIYWLLGSHAVSVSGIGGIGVYDDQDTLDHALLHYTFENGVKVSFGYSTFVPGHYKHSAIFGSHGRIEFPRYDTRLTLHKYTPPYGFGRSAKIESTEFDLTEESSSDLGFHLGTHEFFKDFVRCIRERKEMLTNGYYMVDSVRMCVAGQDAIRSGQTINLRTYDK